MVNRSGIGKRMRAKALKKLNEKKKINPEKYQHTTSEKSIFLAMDYDYKKGNLPDFKKEKYFELKKKFEEDEQ